LLYLLGEQEREERELRSASRSSGRSSERVYMNTHHHHNQQQQPAYQQPPSYQQQPAYQNHFFQPMDYPDRCEASLIS
jgi:hypothetical protein